MTDILLGFVVAELAVVIYLLAHLFPKRIVSTPSATIPTAPSSTPPDYGIYDADGKLRFTRPASHPDVEEVRRGHKDGRFKNWRVEPL